jgi:solute carrier family 44 (choline transporter-like protein), member 1
MSFELQSRDDVHYWSIVVFVICLFAYFIADVCLDLYKMTLDTIFLCFSEDCKHNNGRDKPYFMSNEFVRFLTNANELLKVYAKK